MPVRLAGPRPYPVFMNPNRLLTTILLSSLFLAATGCVSAHSRAEQKVRMYETLAPDQDALRRGDLRGTYEIADRMAQWADNYSAENRIPLKARLELSRRLKDTLPRYLLRASEVVADPVQAHSVLTYRPFGARRLLTSPESVEAARRHAAAITAAKQNAFVGGSYPRVGAPHNGREQGTCFFATQPFGTGRNPGITFVVQKGVYARCHLPSWWKTVAAPEGALLIATQGHVLGKVPLPPTSATQVDFILDGSGLGPSASAESLNVMVAYTVHDLVLKAGQTSVLVGKDRNRVRVAGAEFLWVPSGS